MVGEDAEIDKARSDALREILDSDVEKKLIVAGPGTGKTHTFREALKQCGGRGLALTFIRNLVADLASALEDVADVFTFHGFCRHLVHSNPIRGLTKDWDYYPSLTDLVLVDLEWLGHGKIKNVDLDGFFHRLDEDEPALKEALRLGDYYDATGHTDLVYRALRHFQDTEDRLPEYPLIVVDEYQDFSRLEISFLDLLAATSPVLIAGDDDQALYAFKHASPQFIRDLSSGTEYTNFELPYCSRCPEVVVAAVNDTIGAAVDGGHLEGLLEKPFECYSPAKRADSEAHPHLIHARCSVERANAPYTGRYISGQIATIPEADILESKEGDGYPTVLVIGPNPFLGSAYEVIRQSFPQAELKKARGVEVEPLDGYRRLLSDERSRLGWRILVHCYPPADAQGVVTEALSSEAELADVLSKDFRDRHLQVLGWLRELEPGGEVTPEITAHLEERIGQSLDEIRATLGIAVDGEDDGPESEDRELSPEEPSIVCTSLVGAKGLSAAYVFIVGFCDEHFPRDRHAISDDEICSFLVGLSRTRKECHLVSCGRLGQEPRSVSVFASWVDSHLIHRTVNAAYFQ